jgi:hypothetical protein
VQCKLRSRSLAQRNDDRVPSAVLNLDFNDLATIVKGQPDDEVTNRPFDCHVTTERILRLWGKVGFVPFTMNYLTKE